MKTEGEVRQASANAVPGWLADGPFAEPDEEELERERLEIELMAYAHRAAMTWGAERFAEEFDRREQEEARLLAAESRAHGMWDDTGPYAGLNATAASAATAPPRPRTNGGARLGIVIPPPADAMTDTAPPDAGSGDGSDRSALRERLGAAMETAARESIGTPEPISTHDRIAAPEPVAAPEPIAPRAAEMASPARAEIAPPAAEFAASEAVDPVRAFVPPTDVAPAQPFAAPAPAPVPTSAPEPIANPIGPVLAETEEHITEVHTYGLDLHHPVEIRHPHVPRPPQEEAPPAPMSRKERRRAKKKADEAPPQPAWFLTEEQASRMSAAGRRLYGLPPLPDPRRQP